MVPALQQMGLGRAAEDGAAELAALGGAPVHDARPPKASAHARIFGRYDLVREVASSPSARVLECMDLVRSERVAVKVFAAWDARGSGRDALTRFEREVRALRALDHPNVVPLRDFVPEGPAIVLGWMAGGTLERLLAATAPLAPARAVEIAAAVLSALGEAHRLGILHRDVKPANVLFDDAGGARLGDFGVAHLSDVSTTATAGVFGTLAYMSPEQREGRPATTRSDIFSVGVMLREMLTAERPSPGEPPRTAPKTLASAHRDLDVAHDDLVARLTAADPSGRPDDAFEARRSLFALQWPATVDVHGARTRSERQSSAWPRTARLEAGPGVGPALDTWTGRHIERVALTEQVLARASAFARAGHPALQGVLRVDRDAGAIWLEAPSGPPANRTLWPAEQARLRGALDALHAAGCVHGHVDVAHVILGKQGVVLRFDPEQEPTATVDRDRLALARL
jgi:serine/threonine-protein kinase